MARSRRSRWRSETSSAGSVWRPVGINRSRSILTESMASFSSEYRGVLRQVPTDTQKLQLTRTHGGAHAPITNHAIGGPVISGPQVLPWVCRNSHPTDAECDEAPTYSYEYKNAVTGSLEPYNPESPPSASAIASTTTDNGTTVPYIIRIERGYEDRDQYRIAVLFQPGKPWEPWAPQPQFDHKLLITHGASCGIEHESGSAPSVIDE